MNAIVVFVEEPSARIVVDELVRRLGLGEHTLCLEHQGKADLERSMARKLRAWQGESRFIVMRDNDGANCLNRKAALRALVPLELQAKVKLRIVMQELESWYLGDPQALSDAGLLDAGRVQHWSRQAKFRNPDEIRNAKEEFRRRFGTHGQRELAHLIGPRLDLGRNRSHSFHSFVGALRWAAS